MLVYGDVIGWRLEQRSVVVNVINYERHRCRRGPHSVECLLHLVVTEKRPMARLKRKDELYTEPTQSSQKSMRGRERSMRLLVSRVRHVTFSQAARAMLNRPCLQYNTHCKRLYFYLGIMGKEFTFGFHLGDALAAICINPIRHRC
jgi:hypothetical protein